MIENSCPQYQGVYSEDQVRSWPAIQQFSKGIVYDGDTSTPVRSQVVFYPTLEERLNRYSVFHPGDVVLYLGEVANMNSHGVFVDRNGKIVWGYHIHNFRVIPEAEL